MVVEIYSSFPRAIRHSSRDSQFRAGKIVGDFHDAARLCLDKEGKGDLGSLRNCILQLYATRVSKFPTRDAVRDTARDSNHTRDPCARARVRACARARVCVCESSTIYNNI